MKDKFNLALIKTALVAGSVAGFLGMATLTHAAPPVADPTAVAAMGDVTTGISNTYFAAWVIVLGVIGGIIVTGLIIRFVLRKVKGAAH